MERAIQKRTLETRARLVAAADEVVGSSGFDALRVEEIVLKAGVAKGTFFAHFKDKDALMDKLIGARLDRLLDQATAGPSPESVEEIASRLLPLMEFMTCERYVFDVCLRLSGAMAVEEIGSIAMTFGRFQEVVSQWVEAGRFRDDLSPELLAEGVHAFVIQTMALRFCALHNSTTIHDRLLPYLKAWLTPAKNANTCE